MIGLVFVVADDHTTDDDVTAAALRAVAFESAFRDVDAGERCSPRRGRCCVARGQGQYGGSKKPECDAMTRWPDDGHMSLQLKEATYLSRRAQLHRYAE